MPDASLPVVPPHPSPAVTATPPRAVAALRLLPAVVALASAPPAAQPPDVARAADVRAVARAFDRAPLERDSATLARLLADDLVYVRGSGALAGKREFLATFTAPGFRLDPFTVVRPTFVPLGPDAAIVGGETTLSGSAGGERFTQHLRYADTFLRRRGRWRVVHVQVTEVR